MVATPPIFKVVAVVLKIFPVALVVVIDPPLTATLPLVVILPEEPVIEKFVPNILLVPEDKALVMFTPEASMALVIPPAADCILIPEGSVSLVSWLLIRRSWEGGVGLLPSLKERLV